MDPDDDFIPFDPEDEPNPNDPHPGEPLEFGARLALLEQHVIDLMDRITTLEMMLVP